jgi:hypothetical protein
MTTINLGPEAVPLTVRPGPSFAIQLIRLSGASPEAAGGAALIASCPAVAKKAKIELDRTDLMECGSAMYDWLIGRGLSIREASAACSAALQHVLDILPTQPEVEEAEGNSEPTP